ncbi:MAG: hypothetical protein R3223_05930 [Longimicrobiales bacterium]|nr:hypothetical protein [Longimicrobiales bacterium]
MTDDTRNHSSQQSDGDSDRSYPEPVDWTPTMAGAGVSGGAFLVTLFLLGRLGASEAISILEATLPTIRFLCSSAIAATSTVLALMLTLLGVTERTETRFEDSHYARIRQVATLCVIAMVVAIGLLLFMSVPISESQELIPWYEAIYYTTFVVSAGLGGVLVAVVLILRKAVLNVVRVASPHRESSAAKDGSQNS